MDIYLLESYMWPNLYKIIAIHIGKQFSVHYIQGKIKLHPPSKQLLFEFCCSLQNYNNAYGGQQLPLRWLPAYCQPFYGLGRQFIPTAYVKKAQTPNMSPQEFTVVGFSEPISASPSISSTGSASKLQTML